MTDHNRSGAWDDIDAGEDTDYYTAYLETLTGAEAVQAYKRRSHRLLRPAEGDRLLDVGCGTGEDALLLAERVGADGAVVGIDSSDTMVETARERGRDVPTVRFAIADACALSFPDGTFDATRADRVLQHLETPAKALAELRRVTRPGGRVGISDPDWRTALVDTPGGYSERFLSLDYAVPRTPTMGRRLHRLARDAGLVDIDIDTWTLTTTDFAFLNAAGELEAWTDAMQAAGEVTATAVADWFEGLHDADEQGELFGSITGFTIVGTVPEQDE